MMSGNGLKKNFFIHIKKMERGHRVTVYCTSDFLANCFKGKHISHLYETVLSEQDSTKNLITWLLEEIKQFKSCVSFAFHFIVIGS